MNKNNFITVLVICFLLFCLIGVRFNEKDLFYDPFLAYFKSNKKTFPDVDFAKLIFSHLFRYFLNMTFSLGIIYFWFKNSTYLKYSLMIFCILFLILFPIYLYQINVNFSLGENPVFTIRRFLIQPVLLFVLIPSFYYIRFSQKKG